MEIVRLTITLNYDGPLLASDVDDVVERLETIIGHAIEHGRLNTIHAEPQDYEFEYEAE